MIKRRQICMGVSQIFITHTCFYILYVFSMSVCILVCFLDTTWRCGHVVTISKTKFRARNLSSVHMSTRGWPHTPWSVAQKQKTYGIFIYIFVYIKQGQAGITKASLWSKFTKMICKQKRPNFKEVLYCSCHFLFKFLITNWNTRNFTFYIIS